MLEGCWGEWFDGLAAGLRSTPFMSKPERLTAEPVPDKGITNPVVNVGETYPPFVGEVW